jgi:hypothetical protein
LAGSRKIRSDRAGHEPQLIANDGKSITTEQGARIFVQIGDVARGVPGRGEHAKCAGDEVAISDERISSYCTGRSFFEESAEQNERAEFGNFFAEPRAETSGSSFTSEKRSILGCVVNGDAETSF